MSKPGASPTRDRANAERPNLLIVLTDQMRMHAMGFWNTPGFELNGVADPVLTPRLDRLADESLVLRQAVSTHPVCSPYRGSFMTGQYSFRNRVHWNCTSRTAPFGCELQENARCWSDILSEKGYSLGYIGKWHLDAPREPYVDTYNNKGKLAWNEWCPPSRRHGFDFWYSYGTFDRHLTPMYWPTHAGRDDFVRIEQWGPEHEADLAIRYIRNDGGDFRRSDRPFALVVSMNPPHTPYDQVPRRYVERYEGKTWRELLNRPNVDTASDSEVVRGAKAQIKNYLAMVTGVDEQLGRILDCLDRQGLADDTVVVFTSDHGNCVGSHGYATKNVPVEESFRIPFLARRPGRIPVRVDDLLFGAADVMPTLLGLLGFGEDVPAVVEGTDFSPLFLGGDMERPSAALYLNPTPQGRPEYGERGVRTDRFTLVVTRRPDELEACVLYDNVDDPYQLRNTASEQPELVRDLREGELTPILRRIDDPWLEV